MHFLATSLGPTLAISVDIHTVEWTESNVVAVRRTKECLHLKSGVPFFYYHILKGRKNRQGKTRRGDTCVAHLVRHLT